MKKSKQVQEMRVYKSARPHISDADAAIIGPFLEALAALSSGEVGGLRPNDIVRAAEPEDSPLHRFFEWDDSEAARSYRLHQARNLARSWRIEIVRENLPTRVFPVSGLVSIRVTSDTESGGERRYVQFSDAEQNPEYLAQLVQDAWRRLRYWRNLYEQYSSFPQFASLRPVFDAMDDASDNVASA